MYKLFLLFFFCISSSICFADAPSVNNLPDAIKLSEKTGMSVLVVFSRKSCVYCDSLKQDIHNNLFTKQLGGYILCFVDADSEPVLAKTYGIKGVPDSRIIKNNKEISRMVGYSQKKYSKWLTDAAK